MEHLFAFTISITMSLGEEVTVVIILLRQQHLYHIPTFPLLFRLTTELLGAAQFGPNSPLASTIVNQKEFRHRQRRDVEMTTEPPCKLHGTLLVTLFINNNYGLGQVLQ